METNKNQFINGFNSGYYIAKSEPELLKFILKSIKKVNSYILGMSYGQKEYLKELENLKLNELKQLRTKEKNQLNRDLD
ncbi:MAG TPA: hypothetical protein PLS73_08155 [Saprospiraceae bacterium]|nr:hypothetical protein [Saprospiraceae bacterium]